MASHRQSFKCFDAIPDEPPLKHPVPHCHCSATPFRVSSSSAKQEQLEERQCYLCAEHQSTNMMTSEATGAHSNPWNHHPTHHHCTSKRTGEVPGQAEEHHGHSHCQRRSRKIVLVKNSDPSVCRSIVLRRRSLRSLSFFMDEVSELMCCLIRKLYTVQGHKIDSVHSLLQCPGIVVCAGREPFHPLLLESFRKHSHDKLPSLNTKSHPSVCSDEKTAKKNVNFGLETKKSTIHPRYDSSNRSTRLSLSSDRSLPNRLGSLPSQHRCDCPRAGEDAMDDDIEKRVLVNKDGSLSMEMKVRFRLSHNETLHWSTEVKKSKSTFNESHIISEDACSLTHGSAETCSEADSLSGRHPDEDSKRYRRHFEEPHCRPCCGHCQEYDIWRSPVPPSQGNVRHIHTSSSSASSHRIVSKKASTESMHTVSSEEYVEEKLTCIQQTFAQEYDTTIEQCTINHCCSQSEVSSVSSKVKSPTNVDDKCLKTCASDEDENGLDDISTNLPGDHLNVTQIEEDDRPVSVVSASSQILASLKEDQEDDIDFTLSVSRASRGQQEDGEKISCSASPCKSTASVTYLSPRPPSKGSSLGKSKRSRRVTSSEMDAEVFTETSTFQKNVSGTKVCKSDFVITSCDCESNGRSKRSNSINSPSELSTSNKALNSENIEERSSSAISMKSNRSGKSVTTNLSELLEQDLRTLNVLSRESDKPGQNENSDNFSEVRTLSEMSFKSDASERSRKSESGINTEDRAMSSNSYISVLEPLTEEEDTSTMEEQTNNHETGEKTYSPLSTKSDVSANKGKELHKDTNHERASSATSKKSSASSRSRKSGAKPIPRSGEKIKDQPSSAVSVESIVSRKKITSKIEKEEIENSAYCALSAKSDILTLSTKSHTEQLKERSSSAQSVKSNGSERSIRSRSASSDISNKSYTVAKETCENAENTSEEQGLSALSPISKASVTSKKSKVSERTAGDMDDDIHNLRSESIMSSKSEVSEISGLATDYQVETIGKPKEQAQKKSSEQSSTVERPLSAISVKSDASERSKKSKCLKVPNTILQGEEQVNEERSQSVLSISSGVSLRSNKSEISKELPIEPVDSNDRKEERASSTLSVKSNISAKSKSSCTSLRDVYNEDRVPSELSATSNSSPKDLNTSAKEVNKEDKEPGDRVQSVLSTKSNISSRSNKSRVSEELPNEPVDSNDHEEERASSVLSAKSNISAKSKNSTNSARSSNNEDKKGKDRIPSMLSVTSNISTKSKNSTNLAEEANKEGNESGDRVPSALSMRSNISSISNKSMVCEELPNEHVDSNDHKEERTSSAFSAKSDISAKTRSSCTSLRDACNREKESEDRIPSVLSATSNISTKSKNAIDYAEEAIKEGIKSGDRVPSALSTRSNFSSRSNKSKVSEELSNEPVDSNNHEEVSVSSALSAKSNISAKSKNSTSSTKHGNKEDNDCGDRVPSVLSSRSSVSSRSNKYKCLEDNISSKSKKSSSSTKNVGTDDNDKGDRISSSLSGRSDISTKSNVSAKLRVSAVQHEECNDENKVDSPCFSKSRKSETSADSKIEGQSQERPSSAISVKSETTGEENELSNVGEVQERASSAFLRKLDHDRASSALSAKSNISTKSKRSNGSATQMNTVFKEVENRGSSAMSERSNYSTKTSVSAKSKASNVSEVRCKVPDDDARSKSNSELECQDSDRPPSTFSVLSESTPDENETRNEAEVQERMSLLSNSSVRSKISEIIITEPDEPEIETAPSSRSLQTNVSGRSCPDTSSIIEKRSLSPVSVTSRKSRNSNVSGGAPHDTPNKQHGDVQASSVLSAKTDTSKCSVRSGKKGEKTEIKASLEETEIRSSSKLSVESNASARSKKSTGSETGNYLLKKSVERPISAQSKVSELENPNKPENVSDHDNIPGSPLSKKSGKSRISSTEEGSERALTPTSTSMSVGIVEDQEADDFEKINGDALSVKSSITEQSGVPEQPEISNRAKSTPGERPNSLSSCKSAVSGKSMSKCPHCSTCPSDQDREDMASDKSSKSKHLETKQSINCSDRQRSPTQQIRASSKGSFLSIHTETTGQDKAENQDDADEPQSVCSKCSTSQPKRKMSPVSCGSAASSSAKSKANKENSTEMNDRPNSKTSSSHLKMNCQKKDLVNDLGSDALNSKSSEIVEDRVRCHSSVTSGNHLCPTPPKSLKQHKTMNIVLSEPVLLQTTPIPDQRKKHDNPLNSAIEKTNSYTSNTSVSDVKSDKNSKCRKSNSSCHKNDNEMSELSPSFLPNASPTEVVNEWLRKIPSDNILCDLCDEFNDSCASIEQHSISHTPLSDEKQLILNGSDGVKSETKKETGDTPVMNAEGPVDNKSESDKSQGHDGPKIFDSSVYVMKVLLSPTLGRCNSLPEVSHVYGRKLSTSAQGLLDCLANLQLLDLGPCDEDGKREKYQELMNMLKSLWLSDPKDREKGSEGRCKLLEDELKARSSSGVDVNSGSIGSGKSSVNGSTQLQINTEFDALDILTKVQEVDEGSENEALKIPESKYDSATSDVVTQAHCNQESKDANEEKLKEDVQCSDETIRSNDSPRELIETPLSSNKSSGNNQKQGQNESDRHEDTSSGSAPALQRGPPSRRASQDPDPVWVLTLLNQLEEQFMTHYVDAMTEFKVRWNLDDNEQLDTMICELQEEVRKRIQLSINRELKKIRGRAGKPRPSKETLSRESTLQTEQRRRRLKVMRNQSIDQQPANSDDDNTITGTDFSDQRSDDDYCPCESCFKKKMASKPLLPAEMLSTAPVMMDFDLRRILQIKKSCPGKGKREKVDSECCKMDKDNLGLEAVTEEDVNREINPELSVSKTQETDEQGSREGDEEDNASSTCIENSSDRQSFICLRKVVDGNDKTDETSDCMMTARKEVGDDDVIDEKADDERIAVDDTLEEAVECSHVETAVDETFDDKTLDSGQSTETAEDDEKVKGREGAGIETAGEDDKVEAGQSAESKTAGEDDKVEAGQSAESKTAEEDGKVEAGQSVESETVEEDGNVEAGQSTKSETVEEDGKVEAGQSADSGTAEEDGKVEAGQSAESETAEEDGKVECEQSSESETAEEDGKVECEQISESETAEEDGKVEAGQSAESETAEENEKVEAGQSAESETAEEDEKSKVVQNTESEVGEEDEKSECEQSAESETAENENNEVGQTAEDETTEEDKQTDVGEGAEDEKVKVGQSVKNETEEEDKKSDWEESAENENADDKAKDGQTAKNETGEEGKKSDGEGSAEDKTAEDGNVEGVQSAEDETAEEDEKSDGGEGAEDETAEDENEEDGQTAEDETAEDGKVEGDKSAEDETAEEDEKSDGGEGAEDETAEDENEEDGQTTEDETAEEDEQVEGGQTTEDETAEEDDQVEGGQTAENETAEDEKVEGGQLSEDETAENIKSGCGEGSEDEIADKEEKSYVGEGSGDKTAEEDEKSDGEEGGEDEAAEDENVEGEQTAENGTAEEDEKSDGEESAEDKTAEDEKVEGGQLADDETAEDEKSGGGEDTEDEIAEKEEKSDVGEGSGDETAEEDEKSDDGESAEDEKVEGGQSAEDETAEDENIEGGHSAEDETTKKEKINTAEVLEEVRSETSEDREMSGDETKKKGASQHLSNNDETEECEKTNDNCPEDCETGENDSAGEGQTDEDDGTENPGESDATEDDKVKESETTDDELEKKEETDEAKTTEGSEAVEDESDEERETWMEERGADKHKADETGIGEHSNENGTSEHISLEEKETSESANSDKETTESEGENTGSVECGSNAEDGNTCSEQNSDKQRTDTEEEADNSDSTEERQEDTESQDVLTNPVKVNEETPLINNGDVVVDSVEESCKEDESMDKMAIKCGPVFNIGESAEAGDEADENSEPDIETDEGEHGGKTKVLPSLLLSKQKDENPEIKSLIVPLNGKSESEDGAYADVEDSETDEHSQVVNSESELKVNDAIEGQQEMEKEEDEVEDDESQEYVSDEAEDSSCLKQVAKMFSRRENAKLSDITEDTAEDEDQTNRANDELDGSAQESFETFLAKQITKTSLESQPGSLEEDREEETKS